MTPRRTPQAGPDRFRPSHSAARLGGLAVLLVIPFQVAALQAQPLPSPSTSFIDFGSGVQWQPTTRTFLLRNLGTEPFSVMGANMPSYYFFASNLPIPVGPGDSVDVAVRYLRYEVATHTGNMRVFTDDPLHPHFDITLTGQTFEDSIRIVFGPAVNLPPVIAGYSVIDSTWVEPSVGPFGTITSVTTSTPAFTPLVQVPLIVSQRRNLRIRLQSNQAGAYSDTLVIVSNDMDEPVHKVPLFGVVQPPPLIEVDPESLGVELAFADTTSRPIEVRNVAQVSPLTVAASVVVDSVQFDDPVPDLGTTTLPQIRLDFGGHAWDIQGNGSIGTGDADAFDAAEGGGLEWQGFPDVTIADMRDGGRTLRLSAAQGGLLLEREIHVSMFESWIRYLDTVTNPGASPVQVTIPIRSRLDLASPQTFRTSSGGPTLEPIDDWIVVEDIAGPVVGHVFAGPGALRPTSTSIGFGMELITYRFQFTVEPGASVSILHYALQAATKAEAMQRAENLRFPHGPELVGLDTWERARIRNFAMGTPFTLSASNFVVGPGLQQELSVGFDAWFGSGGNETIFGTVRFASDDLARPLVRLPIELRISGSGGPDPLPVEPMPGTLALAAEFVPNPSLSGHLQMSYVLPESGTARFELYDVRGRRIAERTLEHAPAGPGTIRWGVEKRLAAGVVWMRLTQRARTVTARAVILP